MLNQSLDGKRLYMTNSLDSTWDNQFYPDFAKQGSYLMQFDCNLDGSLTVNENFSVDFAKEPTPPVRAHEIASRAGIALRIFGSDAVESTSSLSEHPTGKMCQGLCNRGFS